VEISEDIKVQQKHTKHFYLFLNGSVDQLTEGLEEIEYLDGINGYSVSGYTESPFCGLHPEAVRMMELPDDYFLGLRAEHFVLIFGTSEAVWVELSDSSSYMDDCVALLANHKGGLMVKVFRFKD
jgi:hypothetical protein